MPFSWRFPTILVQLVLLTSCLNISVTEKSAQQTQCYSAENFYDDQSCLQSLKDDLLELENKVTRESVETITTISGSWGGFTLAKDGNLYALPYQSGTTRILKFDPRTQLSTLSDDVGAGTDRYPNSVLGKNGKIYSFSERGTPIHILEFDPTSETHRKITIPGITANCVKAFHGTAISFDGTIYGIPACARRIVSFNPTTDAISLVGPDLLSLGGSTYRWMRSVTTFDDKILATPHFANRAGETPQILEIDGSTGSISLTPIALADLQRVGSPLEGNTGVIVSIPIDGSSTKSTLLDNGSYSSGAVVTVTDYWVTVKGLNGKGYTIGFNGRAYEIDLVIGTLTDLGVTGLSFSEGGALAPDGNIYFVPYQGDKITKINFSGNGSLSSPVFESFIFNGR